MKFSHHSIQRHHISGALLVALLFVGGLIAQKYRPGFSSATIGELEITCSSLRETNPCKAARPGAKGDWISNGEKESAWIQYTASESVFFTGATLINRGAVNNDILDGHFEFGGSRRYPQEGGIGPLENLTEPITFPKPVKSKTIKFVVDKVSAGTVDVGLAVFEAAFTPVASVQKVNTELFLAITILSDDSETIIERIEPVKREGLWIDREVTGLHTLQALDEDDQVIDRVLFTPSHREIITSFSEKGPEAVSVLNNRVRTTVTLPYQASLAKLAIIDGFTNERIDVKVLPDAFLDLLKSKDEKKPIIIPFLEKIKELLK